ncbi:MAG: trigger factor [Phycisphaerae bacterium]|nr:trigger factor [Phycisphaerae bacterium]
MADEDQVQNQEQTETPEPLSVNVASVEDVGTLKKKVTIEIPEQEVNKKLDQNFGELANSAQVPGFRVGRAPRRLVEKRFAKDVREQVRLTLMAEGIQQALEKADLKTIGEPDFDMEKVELPENGPMTFAFEVEVEPEFELPSLDGIEVTEKDVEVTDKDIDEQIENIRWRLAVLEDQPEDAKVEKGDHITADMSLEVGDLPPEVRHEIDLVARDQPIEGVPFDKLDEALAGAAVGETREAGPVTVSQEHANENWRGKEAKVRIGVKKISKWRLPEANDELAKKIGFGSVQDWRDTTRTQLEARKGQQVRRDLEDQVRSHLLANTKLDLPEGLIERQTDRALVRRVIELRQMGFPEVVIRGRIDELRTGARDRVVDDLKFSFIVDKIARQFEIEVTEGEVNSLIANIAASQGRRPERAREEMMRDGSYDSVFGVLRERKVLEKLLDNAKITKAEGQAKEQK